MNNKQEAFLTAVNGPVVSTEGLIDSLTGLLSSLGLRKKANSESSVTESAKKVTSGPTEKQLDDVAKALLNVTEVRKLPLTEGYVEGRFVAKQLYGDGAPFSVVHQKLTTCIKGLKQAAVNHSNNLTAMKKTIQRLAADVERWGASNGRQVRLIEDAFSAHTGNNSPFGLDPLIQHTVPGAISIEYWNRGKIWVYGDNEHPNKNNGRIPALGTPEVIAVGKLIAELRSLAEIYGNIPDPSPGGTDWGLVDENVSTLLDYIFDNCDESGHAYHLAVPKVAGKYGWMSAMHLVEFGCEELIDALLIWVYESIDKSQYEISTESIISMESWFGFGGKDGPDSDTKRLLGLLKDNDVNHTPVSDQALANLSEKLGYPLSAGVSDLYRYVGSFRSESGESPLVVHDPKQVIEATEKLLKITKQFKDPVVFASTYGGSYIYIAAGKYIIESYIDVEDGELNIQGRHSGTPAKFLTGEPADKQWR